MKKCNETVTLNREGGSSSFFYADPLQLRAPYILFGLSHDCREGATGRVSVRLSPSEARQVADLILRAVQEAEGGS